MKGLLADKLRMHILQAAYHVRREGDLSVRPNVPCGRLGVY